MKFSENLNIDDIVLHHGYIPDSSLIDVRLRLVRHNPTQLGDETIVIVGQFGELLSERETTISELGFGAHKVHHNIIVVPRVDVDHVQWIFLAIFDHHGPNEVETQNVGGALPN